MEAPIALFHGTGTLYNRDEKREYLVKAFPLNVKYEAGRAQLACYFPNEASLLRLASAVLSEISDDWETERAYLNMEAR